MKPESQSSKNVSDASQTVDDQKCVMMTPCFKAMHGKGITLRKGGKPKYPCICSTLMSKQISERFPPRPRPPLKVSRVALSTAARKTIQQQRACLHNLYKAICAICFVQLVCGMSCGVTSVWCFLLPSESYWGGERRSQQILASSLTNFK